MAIQFNFLTTAAFLLATLGVGELQAQNAITNGGFNTEAGWTISGTSSIGNYRGASGTEDRSSDGDFWYLTLASGNLSSATTGVCYQQTTVTPGSTMRFRIDYRRNGSALNLYVDIFDGAVNAADTASYPIGSGGLLHVTLAAPTAYTTYTSGLLVPTQGQVTVRLADIGNTTSNARDLWVDNARLQTEDTDADGLPDPWELSFPGVTSLADLDGTKAAGSGPGSGTGDFDGDGLSDFDEYSHLSNPTLTDSDDDGLSDGNEVSGILNPYRSDHVAGDAPAGTPGDAPTDPAKADSDNDGINDGEEIAAGNDGFITNPNAADTDGDGMDDGYEVLCNTPATALDPTDDGRTEPTQAPTGDRDGDGLANIEEFDPAQGPNTSSPQTRADLADTDDDGYGDLAEDNYGSWLDVTATGTNPTKPDTDGDGIKDGKENPDSGTPTGPVYNTKPSLSDTDGDLYSDGYEVAHGSDPTDIDSVPVDVVSGIQYVDSDLTNTFLATTEAALTTDEYTTGSGYPSLGAGKDNKWRIRTAAGLLANVWESGTGDVSNTENVPEVVTIITGLVPGATYNLYGYWNYGPNYDVQWSLSAPPAEMSPSGGNSPGINLGTNLGGINLHAYFTNGTALGLPTTPASGGFIQQSLGSAVADAQGKLRVYFDDVVLGTDGSSGNARTWVDGVGYEFVSAPSIPLLVLSCGFNGGAFELTVTGFDTSKSYMLKRSADLTDGFPFQVGDAFTPATVTQVVSDPEPPADGKAFYRVEETTP